MSEHADNLVLELLRQMRGDIASIKDDMSMMRAEMRVMRQHTAGIVGTQSLQDVEVATLRVRMDRIERRLELVD